MDDGQIVVIHQPDFLSWPGFFDRLLKADIYVVFDNVQYVSSSSKSWMNRDKIKTAKGEKWLTVGVHKAPRDTPINQIMLLEDNKWRRDNLNLLYENYRKAPYYHEIMPYIEQLYAYDCRRMMDFNLESIRMLCNLFDIQIEMVIASTLDPVGRNNSMVVDIMQKLGCHRYLSGEGARNYYDPIIYENAGIEVIWQKFVSPVYPQQYEGFLVGLSSIDLFFNCGIDMSRKLLRDAGKQQEL